MEFLSIEAFEALVKNLIAEAVEEEMVKELNIKKEAVQGTLSTASSVETDSTTGTTGTTGTKPGTSTNSGNGDPANNVMVPGTNMSLNAGLQKAAKSPNFKEKTDLINKISDQLRAMKGTVKSEGVDGEEPETLQPWQIAWRALRKSMSAVMAQFSAITDELAKSGMKYADAQKMVKALETNLTNLQQSIQLKKDVDDAKARAGKLAAKSPLFKKFLPTVLGGDFDAGPIMEGSDEPETPGKKVNTREPMFPDLVRRIVNLVYYGDKSDEEILADLGDQVDGKSVTPRWVAFMADMVRKGKDL